MATPQSLPNDNAAFLTGCVNKTRSVRDVYESLGLFSQTTDLRKDPDFHMNEANELHARIKQISQSFVGHYRDNVEQFQKDLSREDIFSREIGELEIKYGKAIWGRSDQQEGSLDELNWNRNKDRETILFFIRCWIVRIAVRDFGVIPRKSKGRNKPQPTSLSEDEQSDDGSSHPSRSNSGERSPAPYRAPQAPNMLPAPKNSGKHASTECQNANSQMRADIERNDISGKQSDNDLLLTRSVPVTPAKRKQSDIHGHVSTGKLQRVSKDTRVVGTQPQMLRRDIYSVPRSPTITLNPAQSSRLFERHMQRENTQDTDLTYMPPPRGFTTETETFVDTEEIVADAVDFDLQSRFASEGDGPYHKASESSGSYRTIFRQDSVVPDTHEDTMEVLPELTHHHNILTYPTDHEASQEAPAMPQAIVTEDFERREERAHRRELFKLLLSYLNHINQFSKDAYDADAEDRLDSLLSRLWSDNTEILRSEVGAIFERLDKALKSWMDMRRRLTKFRITTGYIGRPGEQWKAYLDRMLDLRTRAQACIAFADLKAVSAGASGIKSVAETFNDDLAMVFDLLTRVKGCNGVAEFKAIRLYNEGLLEWTLEEDV